MGQAGWSSWSLATSFHYCELTFRMEFHIPRDKDLHYHATARRSGLPVAPDIHGAKKS